MAKCLELDYPDFEILAMPDGPLGKEFADTRVRVIPTGALSPAKKRDLGMEHAKGEVLAFIDDDAYPRKDWLKNALVNFSDPQVAAVGGPAVTPESDSRRQKASGAVLSCRLVSAGYNYRYLPKKRKEVDDFPSCNFLVRKSIMEELGGFQTDFWPGEDTKLCLEITKKLKKKIVYDPEALVYHHRRQLFLPHLRQVESYALHRGYFARIYPETSLRFSYFVPSIFAAALFIGGLISLWSPALRQAYIYALGGYLLLVLFFSLSAGFRQAALVFPGIILTHLAYGIYFLKGFFAQRLKEE